MKVSDITPLILTYNEQENLERTLNSLRWAKRIVIVDSGSDDATLAIARRFECVEVLYRSYDSHTDQWNFGLAQITTPPLCAGTHDFRDPTLPLQKMPLTIADDAWVCADAFVGPDVTVGMGAVVGARAAVFKYVGPWSIVGGNPARNICKREMRNVHASK